MKKAKEELEYYSNKGFPIFLAIDKDDEIVGYIVCRIQDDILWAESLYIIPNKRREGIGSALYAKAEKLSRKLGNKTLYNWVDPNNERSILFLQKKGYNVLNLIELRKKLPNELLSYKIKVGEYEFDH